MPSFRTTIRKSFALLRRFQAGEFGELFDAGLARRTVSALAPKLLLGNAIVFEAPALSVRAEEAWLARISRVLLQRGFSHP